MTSTILIIYAVGVFVNALVAASIWDDLNDEGSLVKVRMVALVISVLASVLTWAYMIVYLLVSLVRAIFRRKPKSDGDKNDN